MARILPNKVNSAFLLEYNVMSFSECTPKSLTIKVWDLYGTAPKESDTITARGEYVAAVIICDTCDKSVELHRKQLTG